MELHEIENLSAAELKERRAELTEVAQAAPPDVLASRFIQARRDAKLRDEKLAEQGATITNLNAAIERLTADYEALAKRAVAAEDDLITARSHVLQVRDTIEKLKTNLSTVAAERDAASLLAQNRRAALAHVMQVIAPLLVAE